MSWKTVIEKQNAKTYILPEGWDSREKIAEELDCSVDRVRIILAPGVKNGRFEVSVFPVWDEVTKRVIRVTAYRQRALNENTSKKGPDKSAAATQPRTKGGHFAPKAR